MQTGDSIRIALGPGAKRLFEVVYVGPFTVRLKRTDGVIIAVKRTVLARKLKKSGRDVVLSPTDPKLRARLVSTPMGGKGSRR